VVAVDVDPGPLRQVLGEALAPRGEVGEDQHPLAGLEDVVDDLLEAGELARSGPRAVVVAGVGGRVVADLLQRGDRGEHRTLLLRGVVVGGLRDELVEHRLVEPDLLGRHRAVVERVDPVGQLGGDHRLGLGPAEHEHPVEGLERRLGAVAALGRLLHLGDERRPVTDEPRVDEVHQRPQVAEPVLDRGARQHDPGPGLEPPQLLGGLARRVLDHLRLVEHHLVPATRRRAPRCRAARCRRW
jgi:hypothetical protein